MNNIKAVYYATGADYEGIAVRPFIRSSDKTVGWATPANPERGYTTHFEEIILSKEDSQDPLPIHSREITIHTDRGKTLTLTYLTLDFFTQYIKPKVSGGNQIEFKGTEDLQKYYLREYS